MKIARSFSLGSCLLFLLALAFALPLRAQKVPAPSCCKSSLKIYAASTVELLVTAPDGLKTGFNPVTGQHVNEIPSSTYFTGPLAETSGAFGSDVQVRKIHIAMPASGVYTVQAIGQEPGNFSIQFIAVNDKGSGHNWQFIRKISPGATLIYKVHFSPDASGKTSVSELTPLASLSADVTYSAGPPPTFQVAAPFTLAPTASAIDPLTQPVSFHVSTYSATIPPGSFKRDGQGDYRFNGTIEGIPVRAKIISSANGKLTFQANVQNIDMTHAINPVRFLLIVGDNAAAVLVNAVPK